MEAYQSRSIRICCAWRRVLARLEQDQGRGYRPGILDMEARTEGSQQALYSLVFGVSFWFLGAGQQGTY